MYLAELRRLEAIASSRSSFRSETRSEFTASDGGGRQSGGRAVTHMAGRGGAAIEEGFDKASSSGVRRLELSLRLSLAVSARQTGLMSSSAR